MTQVRAKVSKVVQGKISKDKPKENKNNIDQYIKDKQDELNKIQKELVTLTKLQSTFPDITYSRSRWGDIRFSSPMVNEIAYEFYTHHSCGCCDDATLLVRAYTEIDGFKVYASPDYVCIGNKDGDLEGGEYLYDNWRKILEKNNYHPNVIAGVEEKFKDCTGDYIENDEGESDE